MVEEGEEQDEEAVEEAVTMHDVVGTGMTSSVTTKTKTGTSITPQVSPSSTRTAPSETKASPEKTAVEEDIEEIGAAQAEEDEVVNAGVEVVEAREAELIIKEIEL